MGIDVDISIGPVDVIVIPAGAGPNELVSGPVMLAGWSILETTGAAGATAKITSGGNPVAVIGVGAGLSDTHFSGDGKIACPQDVTVTVISGTIEGVVYAVPV